MLVSYKWLYAMWWDFTKTEVNKLQIKLHVKSKLDVLKFSSIDFDLLYFIPTYLN